MDASWAMLRTCIAPAVAPITAEAVLGERDEILDVLGVDRFAEGRLVPEPQLV